VGATTSICNGLAARAVWSGPLDARRRITPCIVSSTSVAMACFIKAKPAMTETKIRPMPAYPTVALPPAVMAKFKPV
jgi:hypothetical protein